MTDINPAKPLIETTIDYIPLILLIIGIIIPPVFYFFQNINNKRLESMLPKEEVEPPDYRSIALRKIVLAKNHVSRQEYKEAFTSLSLTLKEYISSTTSVDIKGQTTSEIRNNKKLDQKLIDLICEFMSLADSFKFAGKKAKEEIANKAITEIIRIIRL
jgi:hypothetical protein